MSAAAMVVGGYGSNHQFKLLILVLQKSMAPCRVYFKKFSDLHCLWQIFVQGGGPQATEVPSHFPVVFLVQLLLIYMLQNIATPQGNVSSLPQQ